MPFRKLFRIQWLQLSRSFSPKFRWLVVAAIVFVAMYVAGILIITGLFFDRMVDVLEPGAEAVSYVNENLLFILASLFSVRFFFQKTPRLSIQPYLHLPIRRAHLVIFFQATSVLSLHNVLPLFFFVPFWGEFVLPQYGWPGSICWILGVTGLFVFSHFANILLRTYLTVDLKRFFIAVGAIAAFIVADRLAEGHWISATSWTLFGQLASGDVILLLLIGSATGFVFVYSSILLRARLNDGPPETKRFRLGSKAIFTNARSQVGNLMLLELQLIWRNRRPRTYMLFALFFGTFYVALLLFDSRVSQNILMAGMAGLLASGIFSVNHGQLMFSWESRYFDGILARSVNTRSLVLAKLFTLQLSCALFFLISLPIFLGFAPDLLPLHISFLFYNAGITSVLMLVLAVHNRRPIAIEKGGGFFNYEGFSLRHWLWFIPTAVPPILFLYLMRDQLEQAIVILGAAGALGMLLTSVWSRLFEQLLLRRRHVMAAGFRSNDG